MDKPQDNKKLLKVSALFSTLFGLGYFPLFPGTIGSLAALGLFFLLKSKLAFFIAAAVIFPFAFLFSHYGEIYFREKDCKKIIIDDFLGMMISLLFIAPGNYFLILAAFFTFRALDAAKIYPANVIEDLPGARAIVGDDIVAGLYTLLIIQSVKVLLKIIS